MQCEHVKIQVDDYLNGQLSLHEAKEIKQHLLNCQDCNTYYEATQEMVNQLRAIPAPKPETGFQARVLRKARPASHHRMFLAGFGSAIAATLVLWLGLVTSEVPENGLSNLKTVVLQVEEPRTIQLAFNAPKPVQNVSFSLVLPEGVNLQNRPGKRAFSWSGQLNQGRNVLKLPLIANKDTTGELVARIEQNGTSREFHVPMHVITRQNNNLPYNPKQSTTL